VDDAARASAESFFTTRAAISSGRAAAPVAQRRLLSTKSALSACSPAPYHAHASSSVATKLAHVPSITFSHCDERRVRTRAALDGAARSPSLSAAAAPKLATSRRWRRTHAQRRSSHSADGCAALGARSAPLHSTFMRFSHTSVLFSLVPLPITALESPAAAMLSTASAPRAWATAAAAFDAGPTASATHCHSAWMILALSSGRFPPTLRASWRTIWSSEVSSDGVARSTHCASCCAAAVAFSALYADERRESVEGEEEEA
jgi:hypothetical protein